MDKAERMIAGAIGGLAGGMMMTGGMMAAKKAGVVETPLPLEVERELEERAGVAGKTGATEEKVIAQGGHLALSAMLGAGYGLLAPARSLPAPLAGALYGMGIYAVHLMGVGPALDITHGPWNEEPATVGRRVMMHAMFDAVTALVAGEVEQQLRDEQAGQLTTV